MQRARGRRKWGIAGKGAPLACHTRCTQGETRSQTTGRLPASYEGEQLLHQGGRLRASPRGAQVHTYRYTQTHTRTHPHGQCTHRHTGVHVHTPTPAASEQHLGSSEFPWEHSLALGTAQASRGPRTLVKDGTFREVSDDRSQPPDLHLGPRLGSHRTSRSKMQPQMQNCMRT